MSREGIPMSPVAVKELITESAEKHELSLGELENSIIDEMLKTLPPNPNTTHLAIWCNKYVDAALEKAPHLKHITEKIRNDVGKELRYQIDKKSFDELSEIFKKENPETINTAWIKSKNYALALSIQRGYKNLDGSLDWDFVSRKIGAQDKFIYHKKEYNSPNKEVLIDDLVKILEDENPETFNLEWILKRSGPLYNQIRNQFSDNKDRKDWTLLKEMLGEKWASRFTYSEYVEMLPSLDAALSGLVETLEKYNPDGFSLGWIKDNNHPVYYYFRKNNIKVADCLDKIPEEWNKRWTGERNYGWQTLEDGVNHLIELFKKNETETITPMWIFNTEPRLYIFFRSILVQEEKIDGSRNFDWSLVRNLLPLELKSKWKHMETQKTPTEIFSINKIKTYLDEEKPEVFSPNWIMSKNYTIYRFITKSIKEGVYKDWEEFINKIPGDWINSWSRNIVKKRELNEDINSLNTLLLKDNPSVWSSSWIYNKNPNLYFSLNKFAKIDGWDSVLIQVDSKYKDKWKQQRQTIEDAQRDLIDLLEKNNPIEFSPNWINEHDNGLYIYLKNILNKNNENWDFCIKKLPESWQEKWNNNQKREWNKENAMGFLEELVLRENPSKFSPSWIVDRDATLYQKLKEYSKIDGWDSIIPEKLLPVWSYRSYADRNIENISDLSAELLLLLKKYNPEKFNPSWILEHDSNLLRTTYDFLNDNNSEWKDIISTLPNSWQEKWNLRETSNYSQEKAILILENLLDNNEPDFFSPNWIRDNNTNLYCYLSRQISSGKLTWDSLISKLPEKWKDSWKYKEFVKWDDELVKSELLKLIDENNPKFFSPQWVSAKNVNLYFAILRKTKGDNSKEKWDEFIGSMPENIKNMWTYTEFKYWNFDDAIKELSRLCEENNPKKISPRWILENDQTIYHYLRSNFLVREGLVDWNQVIIQLPEKWQSRWKEKKVFERLLPKENFVDKKSVQDILDTYNSSLYTLFTANSAEERLMREEITGNLITQAQDGNTSALDYLLDVIPYGVENMISNFKILKPWEYNPDLLKEKIRRSIYLHDKVGKVSFFRYLYKVLELSLPQLENKYQISLNSKDRRSNEMEKYFGSYDGDDSIYVFGRKN